MSSTRISPLPDVPISYADPVALAQELGTTADVSGFAQQATSLIDRFIGRPLARADYLDTFRVTCARNALLLARYPVLAVSSITMNGADVSDLIDSLDLDADTGILHSPAGEGWGGGWCRMRIAVSYTAGYVLPGMKDGDGSELPPTVPLDLVRACLDTAKAIFHATDRDPLVRSENEQGIGLTSWLDPDPANGGLPASAAAMLAPWRGSGIR